MAINKLQLLREKTGDYFIQIEDDFFKGKKGDALIIKKDKLKDLIKLKSFEEIPYLPNELLQKYLPDKYRNEIYLLDIKALAKFDYTIISNQIKNRKFFNDVLEFFKNDLAELVFSGSKQIETEQHYIFYLKNE